MLVKRGLLPDTINITITSLSQREITKKNINPKYKFLKHIRNSPKKVVIQDMETGEIIIYSLCIKALNQQNTIESRSLSSGDLLVYALRVRTCQPEGSVR